MKNVHYRILVYCLIAVTLGIITTFGNACNIHSVVSDPASDTPGFKLFKGTTKGFRISFEYPDSWDRVSVDRVGTYSYMPLLPTDCSVIINTDAKKSKGGTYSNSSEAIQHGIDSESTLTDFTILKHDMIQLGQVEGEELMYSYIYPGQDPHMPVVYASSGETVIARKIVIDYQDYIYFIDLLAAADNYENAKPGFEHLIATFKFLN